MVRCSVHHHVALVSPAVAALQSFSIAQRCDASTLCGGSKHGRAPATCLCSRPCSCSLHSSLAHLISCRVSRCSHGVSSESLLEVHQACYHLLGMAARDGTGGVPGLLYFEEYGSSIMSCLGPSSLLGAGSASSEMLLPWQRRFKEHVWLPRCPVCDVPFDHPQYACDSWLLTFHMQCLFRPSALHSTC